MTSPDVFLSSPRVTRRSVHTLGTSSPELPDLQELLRTQKPARPPLRSGSKAAAIPEDALAGFTTARGLWQSAQSIETPAPSALPQIAHPIYLSGEDDSVCIIDAPKKPAKAAPKTRKPRQPKKAVSQPPPTIAAPAPTEASPPQTPSKDQPWKKYRPSPKSAGTSPLSDRIGYDAPPSAQIPVDEEPRLLETDSVSKHFKTKQAASKAPVKAATKTAPKKPAKSTKVSKPEPAAPTLPTPSEPLDMDLEPAPLRRLDWTPPTKQARQSAEPPTAIHNNMNPSRPDESPEEQPQVGFKDLLQSYNCADSVAPPPADGAKEVAGGLGKRKLIEPVLVRENSTSDRSRSASPTKKKGPKKPRTITELATAAYRVQEPEATMPPATLLNYVIADGEGDDSSTDPKGKGKAKPRKRAPPKTSRRKAVPPKPVLLSPGAALKHVANQDFVFGTSSQLAQEKSPTFLRSLHTAMRQSNELEEADFATPLNSDAIEPPEQRRKLWDAAARDGDGALFDVEVINLVDASPALSRIAEEIDPFGYGAGSASVASLSHEVEEADDSLLSLSEMYPGRASDLPRSLAPASTQKGPAPEAKASQISQLQAVPDTVSRLLTLAEDAPESTLPVLPEEPEEPQRPAYETFTDLQLSKQVSKYGFKPVKRRATMIALLDNCWKSQLASGRLTSVSPKRPMTTTSAVSAVSPARPRGRPKKNAAGSSTAQDTSAAVEVVTPTKRPRGRPRKDAASPTKAPVSRAKKKAAVSPARKGKGRATTKSQPAVSKTTLEIPDSESDHGSAATASRSVSPEPMFSSPTTMGISVSMDEDTDLSLTMSPTEQQATLFEHITQAVTSAPRSTDVANPTWYEKMLLYDPVVVEDLAVWLNSGQLTGVGFDGEVSPAEVKKWCESKSVCCLWRDTHRGKERKRY